MPPKCVSSLAKEIPFIGLIQEPVLLWIYCTLPGSHIILTHYGIKLSNMCTKPYPEPTLGYVKLHCLRILLITIVIRFELSQI